MIWLLKKNGLNLNSNIEIHKCLCHTTNNLSCPNLNSNIEIHKLNKTTAISTFYAI